MGLMRRLVHLTRPFTALFALWFAVILGDPGTLHSCAMHGTGGHGGHGARQAPAVSAGGQMHAMHGEHAKAPAGSQEPAAPRPCTCLGHCCAVTVAAPLPTVAILPVPVAVAEERHPLDAPSSDAPAAPDLRLPFANGPPIV
jgi:hypothetical protein